VARDEGRDDCHSIRLGRKLEDGSACGLTAGEYAMTAFQLRL
jgi:hypothetical protein